MRTVWFKGVEHEVLEVLANVIAIEIKGELEGRVYKEVVWVRKEWTSPTNPDLLEPRKEV